MLWKSLKKLATRPLIWALKTFFSDWYYCQTWKWGVVELAARKNLLENIKRTKDVRLYHRLTLESREIILSLFNKNHGGLYLEDFIKKALSVRGFKQLYVVIFTLFLMQLKLRKRIRFQEEIHIIFPGEDNLIEKLIIEIQGRCNNEKDQAIFAWSCILDIIDNHDGVADGIWRGVFVLLTEKTSKVFCDS